jgi:hypothetical protein
MTLITTQARSEQMRFGSLRRRSSSVVTVVAVVVVMAVAVAPVMALDGLGDASCRTRAARWGRCGLVELAAWRAIGR